MSKKELYNKLLLALNQSLVIDEPTHEYWLKNYKTLPMPAVEYFYNSLLISNREVEVAIEAGLEANSPIVMKISSKMKSVKKNYFTAAEADEVATENPDENLSHNLSDL